MFGKKSVRRGFYYKDCAYTGRFWRLFKMSVLLVCVLLGSGNTLMMMIRMNAEIFSGKEVLDISRESTIAGPLCVCCLHGVLVCIQT